MTTSQRNLKDWDKYFAERFEKMPAEKRRLPGSMLSVIPSRNEWEEFCSVVQKEWRILKEQKKLPEVVRNNVVTLGEPISDKQKNHPCFYPIALLTLVHGVAFFGVEDRNYWPHFYKATQIDNDDQVFQIYLSGWYMVNAEYFGLNETDLIRSVFYHVGVPIKYWPVFLKVCKWAEKEKNWEQATKDDWEEHLKRVLGAKKRLLPFFLENRELASMMINEMLEARSSGLYPNCSNSTIRPEYLELPETEEFLENQATTSEANARLLKRLKGIPKWDEEKQSLKLEDEYPNFSQVLKKDGVFECHDVTGLKIASAGKSRPVSCLYCNNALYLDMGQLREVSPYLKLRRIILEADYAGWLKDEADEAMSILDDEPPDKRRQIVKEGANLAERLLLAVGKHLNPLIKLISSAVKLDTDQLAPQKVAELVLDMFGPTTLQKVSGALQDAGLNPPDRWGTELARDFAASIGFPEEYAFSADKKREAEEFVRGPFLLRPLHPEYQEEIYATMSKIIASGTGRRRAVISLPTGGGKTRVTVEAAVKRVLKPSDQTRLVLWIAQADELCEQAVEAFRQVWANHGAEKTDLRIIRLWEGNSNPRPAAKPTVVIASVQTLNKRCTDNELEWLSKPGMVVIDECHHAITKSYTGILKWLDADYTHSGDEPPIFGLSATPFRVDDDESKRLAARFGKQWLPNDQESLYKRLIKGEFLAQPIWDELEPKASLDETEMDELDELDKSLDEAEMDESGNIDKTNLQLEQKLDAYLATKEDRTQELIKKIEELAKPSTQSPSILFFANSIEHAKEIAARLLLCNIKAAAIDAKTPRIARRYFLDKFQQGEISVLCNFNVLSTGFDAPKIDTVMIARVVFSPVRYFQMVGRGLRGIQNGGTRTCRIITVLDNLGRFKDKHAYHYCAKYFQSQDVL